MGVYTCIQAYKKDESYIISENSVLGVFQVDYEKKDKFRLDDYYVSFYGGIQSLHKLQFVNLSYTYNIYENYFKTFMFYALAEGEYGETVIKKEDKIESLLFDSSLVLKGVGILLKIISFFSEEELKELEESGELKVLQELQKILIKAVESGALIGCSTS